jgi:hypothetical protein
MAISHNSERSRREPRSTVGSHRLREEDMRAATVSMNHTGAET